MSADPLRPNPSREERGVIKSPQDMLAGVFLLALALFGYIGGFKLSIGQASGVGPGMLPKATALLIAAFGVLLIVQSLTVIGPKLEQWSIRGLVFILGSLLVFAATVRTLGLAFAGPLAVTISAFAEKNVRLREIIIYALVLTAACIVLFKYVLRLPIPIVPDNFPIRL
jgi:putative tricarboxylic transport membrane protein